MRMFISVGRRRLLEPPADSISHNVAEREPERIANRVTNKQAIAIAQFQSKRQPNRKSDVPGTVSSPS